MKPKLGREVALLSLPVLLFGGAVWWKRVEPPPELLPEKPQLKIISWKKLKPTELDFARGISSKWALTVQPSDLFDMSQPKFQRGGVNALQDFQFAWLRRGKWHRTPFELRVEGDDWATTQDSEMKISEVLPLTNPPSYQIRLGLPMHLLPPDAEKVRLRAQLMGWNGSETITSQPFDITLKAAGESWPRFIGSRASVLRLQSSKQEWNRDYVIRVYINSNTHDLRVHGVFSYSGRAKNGTLWKARSWIVDAAGKEVAQVRPLKWYDKQLREVQNGVARTTWLLSTRFLKSEKGPFTLKSWVYVDPNEWPLKISIPLKISK